MYRSYGDEKDVNYKHIATLIQNIFSDTSMCYFLFARFFSPVAGSHRDTGDWVTGVGGDSKVKSSNIMENQYYLEGN